MNEDFNLGQQIAELRGVISEGFRGIHGRLDTLNHKTAEHEKKFMQSDLEKAKEQGVQKGIQISWGRFLAVVGLVAAVLGVIIPLAQFVINIKH